MFADLPGAEYYEGLARVGAEVFTHAWLVLDGEYVDITLYNTVPVYGWQVTREEIRATLARRGSLGLIRTRELEAAHVGFVRTNAGGHR